jgi:hypothetical protein
MSHFFQEGSGFLIKILALRLTGVIVKYLKIAKQASK